MTVILASAETGLSHPSYAGGEIHSVLAVMRTADQVAAIAQLKRQLLASGFSSVTVIDVAPARFLRSLRRASYWRALFFGVSLSVFDHDDRTGKRGIRR